MLADASNKDLTDLNAVQPHDLQWLVQGRASRQGMYRFRVTNWTTNMATWIEDLEMLESGSR
jgi:hypothetical protein